MMRLDNQVLNRSCRTYQVGLVSDAIQSFNLCMVMTKFGHDFLHGIHGTLLPLQVMCEKAFGILHEGGAHLDQTLHSLLGAGGTIAAKTAHILTVCPVVPQIWSLARPP